jgi:endonuclease/exonuclease/phosphatase family metal-dependent hydrolase
MIIATYNVENLFARAKALEPSMDSGATAKTLAAHAEINDLFNKPTYDQSTQKRIVELLGVLDVLTDDESDLVRLRIIRGKLLTRHNDGSVDVVAAGRADWIGFVELRTEAVDDLAMQHTAMVMRDLKADVLGVVEAESRPTLQMFSAAMLGAIPGGKPYERCMLVEGNDDRGIDVGLLWRESLELRDIRTHVFDSDAHGEIFSRDCCEYHLEGPGGTTLVVLMNHFKSKGYSTPKDPGGGKKRARQAARVAEIYHALVDDGIEHIAVLGDLNDTPDSTPLRPLLEKTDLQDISTHPQFDWQGRHGTYGSSNTDKIDYILLSPSLFQAVVKGGVFRKGVYRGPGTHNPWAIYDTLTAKVHEASDHAAVWAELDL